MLLTAFARILPVAGSLKSTNMNAVRAASGAISVSMRREQGLDESLMTDESRNMAMQMNSLASSGEDAKEKALESQEEISLTR